MNGTGSTPTTPQTSSTSPHGGYDEAEHAEHLKGTYGLPSAVQEDATHFDFLKQPLMVGDVVVHGVGGRYGGLSGPLEVLSFTPKMVRVRNSSRGAEGLRMVLPSNLVKVSRAD